jgi:hypothetical protein
MGGQAGPSAEPSGWISSATWVALIDDDMRKRRCRKSFDAFQCHHLELAGGQTAYVHVAYFALLLVSVFFGGYWLSRYSVGYGPQLGRKTRTVAMAETCLSCSPIFKQTWLRVDSRVDVTLW